MLIENTTTTLATLDLPAGKYLVHGKLDIHTTSFDNTFVACNLTIVGTAGFSDASWNRIEEDGGPGHGEAIALQTPLTLASPGGIALTCITPEQRLAVADDRAVRPARRDSPRRPRHPVALRSAGGATPERPRPAA